MKIRAIRAIKIYCKPICKGKDAKVEIDITDIFTNAKEVSYCLEFSDGGAIKREYGYSLKVCEDDGECLVFAVFDLGRCDELCNGRGNNAYNGFCNKLCNARLIQFTRDKFGEKKNILYSFLLN